MKKVITLILMLFLGSGQSLLAKCWPEDTLKHPTGSDLIGYTTFAPTSLTIWGFANSSETSGCGKSSASSGEMERKQFVTENLDRLRQEIARADGPFLESFSSLLGCEASAYPHFAKTLQARYEFLFPTVDSGPAMLMSQVDAALRADTVLQSCRVT